MSQETTPGGSSAATSVLIQRLRAAREAWVDLDDQRSVLLRRPPETDLARLRHGVTLQDAAAVVVGWRGFTEAYLVGARLGSDTPVAFDAALWREWVADHLEHSALVAQKLAELVERHLAAKDSAAKN